MLSFCTAVGVAIVLLFIIYVRVSQVRFQFRLNHTPSNYRICHMLSWHLLHPVQADLFYPESTDRNRYSDSMRTERFIFKWYSSLILSDPLVRPKLQHSCYGTEKGGWTFKISHSYDSVPQHHKRIWQIKAVLDFLLSNVFIVRSILANKSCFRFSPL